MKMRKVLSMLLATLMLLTMIPLGAVSVSAGSWNTSYLPLTGNGADDIVAVAQAQLEKSQSQLGYYGNWCAAFVSDAASRAGQSEAVPYHASVASLYKNVINAGGYEVPSPQKGDIAFYKDGSSFKHVSIVTSNDGTTIHGNVSWCTSKGRDDGVWHVCTRKPNVYENAMGQYHIYVRPKYKSNIPHSHYHDQYVYYLAAHPHHKCYQCACGDVAANYSTSTYVDTCLECTLPGTPSLSGMKETYTDNELIVFEWEEVKNATHYNILLKIKSENEPSEWVRYDHIFYATNGMTIYLPAGNYQCFLQAYNSNVFWEDGSDWQYTSSVPYYFSVIKECNHTYDNDCDATCNECGATREAGLHNWDVTTGRCIICGEQTSFEYSEWSDTLPVGVTEDAFDIETKAVYRYRDNSSHVSYGEWGAEQTSSTKPIESDTLTITSTTTYYNYYHWCCNYYDGQYNVDSIPYGTGGKYHTLRLTYELSAKNVADKGGKQFYGYCDGCPSNFRIWVKADQYVTYEYKYKTRTATNIIDYGVWSEWLDNEPATIDNRNIESKNVYRYKLKHVHVWDDATCTVPKTCTECGITEGNAKGHNYVCVVTKQPSCVAAGIKAYTCSACGDSYTESIPSTGVHIYDHEYDGTCNVCGDTRDVSIPGDANGDGFVSVRDVALLQQYLAGWDVTLAESAAYADGDGRITVRDVALLQQYLADWEVTLG